MLYTQSTLEKMTTAALKGLAAELGVEPEGDRRKKDTWVAAILSVQQPEKVPDTTTPSVDAPVAPAKVAESAEVMKLEPSPLLSIQVGTCVAHRHCPSQALGWVYRFFTFERVGVKDTDGLTRSCLVKNLVALPASPPDARPPPRRVRR